MFPVAFVRASRGRFHDVLLGWQRCRRETFPPQMRNGYCELFLKFYRFERNVEHHNQFSECFEKMASTNQMRLRLLTRRRVEPI
jgi:hypothetical protein